MASLPDAMRSKIPKGVRRERQPNGEKLRGKGFLSPLPIIRIYQKQSRESRDIAPNI